MARYVHEIVNPEMFWVKPGDSSSQVLGALAALRVTAAPVLAPDGMPLGVVSLRDLIGAGDEPVEQRMGKPAKVIAAESEVEEAARKLADAAIHHLVAIDGEGRATGFVSALDVVRALVGRPMRFPAAFPHTDEHGVAWSDPSELTNEQLEAAPDGPGVFVLVHGGANRPELPVWAEASTNVRTRLADILNVPQDRVELSYLLEHGRAHLRFRASQAPDDAERAAIFERVRAEIVHAGPR